MLAFIPSPHTGVVHVGPLQLHMYGLTLLVAILACIWLTGRRWVALGGDWELVTRVAVWGVGLRRGRRTPLPRRHLLERSPERRSGRASSRSGRAASASGAASRSARSSARWSCAAPARTSASSSTRPRPGCCSRRGSAASATGGTRSSTASRPSLPGAQDRRRPPAAAVLRPATFHPTFLYELIWDVARRPRAALRRAPLQDQAAGALRALRRLVLLRPLLRGAAAHRSGPPHRRPAAERLGLGDPLRRLRRLLHLAPETRARARRAGAAARAAQGACDGDPEGRRVR